MIMNIGEYFFSPDMITDVGKHHDSDLTLFTPAYFDISGTGWGWVGLGFQFFLERTYQWMIDHIQKDSGILDA